MRRSVRLSPEAAADLRQIRAWLRQPGAGQTAAQKLSRLVAALTDLEQRPCAHRPGDDPGTRQAVCANHRIVFRVDPDTGDNATAGEVSVIRIFGPGQSDY